MSLRAKLVVVTLFVALVPLLVSAVTTLRIHQSAFDEKIFEAQRTAARSVAAVVDEVVLAVRAQVERATSAIPWERLDRDELGGAVRLLYQQDSSIAVVTLLSESGESVVSSAFRSPDEPGSNPPASTELRSRLYKSLSEVDVDKSATLSAPIADEKGQVYQPLLIPIAGPAGRRWVVALAWSLSAVCGSLRHIEDQSVTLSNGRGALLCAGTKAGGLRPMEPQLAAALRSAAPGASFVYSRDGVEQVAVHTRLKTGWTLAAERPRDEFLEAGRRIQKQTIFWLVVGLIVAVAAGLYLAQGISKRLAALGKGAEAIASGDLEHRIKDEGGDELGLLADTFNDMSDAIATHRQEIETWNLELQDRVEERTRELKNAQKQLLESKKIAAMASLAAGFAHEVNNPLTGVLGLTQMLRGRLAKDEQNARSVKTLTTIEVQARRIGEIVQTLQNLSEESQGATSKISLREPLSAALQHHAELATKRGVRVETEFNLDTDWVSGELDGLREAFSAILKNAIHACEGGGTVTVRTEPIGDELLKVSVIDDGIGIDDEHIGRVFDPFYTLKNDWGGQGLGLTLAYRIIDQHRGTIEITSTPGKGTTVTVVLPLQATAAHLV